MSLIITIRPLGNLANQMIQFLAAHNLSYKVPNSVVYGPSIPPWNAALESPSVTAELRQFLVMPGNEISFQQLVNIAKSGDYDEIVLADFLQKLEFFPSWEESRNIFPQMAPPITTTSTEILINIRAAELVSGIPHYPLVPLEFYEKIIDLTGLTPVFMGQLGKNEYCERLQKKFLNAKMIPSQGALADFSIIRQAAHIVPAVSTFSWLAAWLSDAKSIYLPMLGFCNPMHFEGKSVIDLLPTGDKRYKFFQFPLHFGVPERQTFNVHAKLVEYCRLISHRQVDVLKCFAPFISVDQDNHQTHEDFDDVWYANTHLDAALEIAQGWFSTPRQHWEVIGKDRGLAPFPVHFTTRLPADSNGLVDLAVNKSAKQSSVSQWSVGETPEIDAARALTGVAIEPFAFHTQLENEPWWCVDLGKVCSIEFISIFNRWQTPVVAGRSTPMSVLISADNEEWIELFTTPPSFIPGRHDKALTWSAQIPIKARFVKITVLRFTFLHLRQVQIFGRAQG